MPAAKQISPSCERNRAPILSVLQKTLVGYQHLLEIGSGTGQHAAYFAPALPHLCWQSSDLMVNHPSILAWQEAAACARLMPPLSLDMEQADWAQALLGRGIDCIFTANTCHIMSWQQVLQMLAGAGQLLPVGGSLLIYGPFNEQGMFTSASNAEFDAMLRQRAPHMGLRDKQDMVQAAKEQHLILQQDFAMPANNRILHWQKVAQD